MSRETDEKLQRSGNAVDLNALAAYAFDRSQGDTDTIDFSSDIDANEVISFDSKSGESPKIPPRTSLPHAEAARAEPESAPVKHQESTLLVDSPLLELQEEMAGEIPAQDSTPHHRVLYAIVGAICVAAAIAAAAVAAMSASDADSLQAASDGGDRHAKHDGKAFSYHMVGILGEPKAGDYVINGASLNAQFPDPKDRLGVQLIDDKPNMIVVYADGFVPYTIQTAADRDFIESPLSYRLEPDDTYQKSALVIRAPKTSDASRAILHLNGKALVAKKEQTATVVSGFPAFIQWTEPGKGDHLHVVWPTRNNETVQLPELESIENARRVTVFKIDAPKDYLRDSSFQMFVMAEDKTTTVAGTRRLGKNELISVKMNKNGRYPFELFLNSGPFGSISVEAYMQLSSRGIAQVSFGKKSLQDATLCFRRASESICAGYEGKTIVPSGRWELVAYVTAEDGSKVWFSNSTYETINEDAEYVFTIKPKKDTFGYDMKTIKTRDR